ncbi:MAG: UTP--glucose-1-phosphate uridylyltransferase [Lachnospiraceae bacterium]|nr:UTP--glucose-1-phosphate uridylyltransferase [Lachnospiraceae bacterium]
MTYEEAVKKLADAGQQHVLRFYDTLEEDAKKALLAQIEKTDFHVLDNIKKRGKPAVRGTFAPLSAMELKEIEANRASFTKTGEEAIRAGKVAAVLLAGGMGTRLGSDLPKGMFDIGETKTIYIFQRLIENLREVTDAICPVRLFIMTSEKNHAVTQRFLKEHDYFGYPEEMITFFEQEMAPACDYEGKVFLEAKDRIATSPNGNAGWYTSMIRAGLDKVLHEAGIEWINIFSVDNVLQRIVEPAFIGACITRGVECGAKVVRKNAPDEAVGVMCLEDGKPSIVEYYDLTKEMMDAKDEKGDPAYNFGVILNYLFYEPALQRIVKTALPLHVVEKKIAHIDEEGREIHPDAPNGCKFEQLVLDMIHELDSCLPYEVVREHDFAPVKNRTGVDSVDTARELLKKAGFAL